MDSPLFNLLTGIGITAFVCVIGAADLAACSTLVMSDSRE